MREPINVPNMMRKITLIPFVLSACFHCQGQEPERLDEIVKAREVALVQILELTKNQSATSAADPEQFRKDTLALFSFRRDSVVSLRERIQWQEQIAAVEKEAKEETHKRVAIGTRTPMDLLRAEERFLAAKQKLLELRAAQ